MKRYLHKCSLCNTEHKFIVKHIKTHHKMTLKEYYDKVNNINETPKCKYCSNECMLYTHKFANMKYREYCSSCSGRHKRESQSEFYKDNPDKLAKKNTKTSDSLKLLEGSHVRKQILTMKSSGTFSEKQRKCTIKLNEKLKSNRHKFEGHETYHEYKFFKLLKNITSEFYSGNNRKVFVPSKLDKSFSNKVRFYLDFLINNLCIEIDGSFHNLDHDLRRDEYLRLNHNIDTIRLTNSQVDLITEDQIRFILKYGKIPVELLETPKAELTTSESKESLNV